MFKTQQDNCLKLPGVFELNEEFMSNDGKDLSAKNELQGRMCRYTITAVKNKLCKVLQKKLEQTVKCFSSVKVKREQEECKSDLCKVQMG